MCATVCTWYTVGGTLLYALHDMYARYVHVSSKFIVYIDLMKNVLEDSRITSIHHYPLL